VPHKYQVQMVHHAPLVLLLLRHPAVPLQMQHPLVHCFHVLLLQQPLLRLAPAVLLKLLAGWLCRAVLASRTLPQQQQLQQPWPWLLHTKSAASCKSARVLVEYPQHMCVLCSRCCTAVADSFLYAVVAGAAAAPAAWPARRSSSKPWHTCISIGWRQHQPSSSAVVGTLLLSSAAAE
jgi:hypothetical protein